MKKYLGVLCAVLLTVACLVVPASAADYPAFDAESLASSLGYSSASGWDYILACGNNNFYARVWPKGFGRVVVNDSHDNVQFSCIVDNSSRSYPWLGFLLRNGSDWHFYNYFYPSNGSLHDLLSSSDSSFYICESSLDVYDSNGELFFQKPLPWEVQTLEAVTGQAPALVTAKLKTTLDCLVPLGIGLMALFVGLLLLRKVFYRFRVKS